MKIRITDLLDDYPAPRIRLHLPERDTASGRETKPRSGRRPLAVAAALLLALTGACALALGLQQQKPGTALGPGVELDKPHFEQITATPSPELSPELSPEPEVYPVEASMQYVQTGETLTFYIALDMVPSELVLDPDWAQDSTVYTASSQNVELVEPLEDRAASEAPALRYPVALDGHVSYDTRGHTLTLWGSLALEDMPETLAFRVRVPSVRDENEWILSETLEIRCAEPGCFVTGNVYTNGWMERLEIRPGEIVADYMVESSLEALQQAAEDRAEDFRHSLLEGAVQLVTMEDQARLEPELLRVELLSTSEQAEGYRAQAEAVYTCNTPEPLEILGVTRTIPSFRDLMELADQNSDGILTVRLDLPLRCHGETGMLRELRIYTNTGEFSWLLEIPELEEALYAVSPEGDLSLAVNDAAFNALLTEWQNCALETWQINAALAAGEDQKMILGGGNRLEFEDGVLWQSDYLTDNLLMDVILEGDHTLYLELGDVRYSFE